MTTIKIKLRQSSVSDRPGSIVYHVTRNSVTRVITTAHKLFPYEWDEEKAEVIPSPDERLKAIDCQIRHETRRLERIIRNLDEGNREYTAEDVVREYQSVSEGDSFFRFMESVILRHEQLNRKGTAKNYHAALESFRRFRLDEGVDLEDMDGTLMEDYEAWLHANRLAPNSVSFYMRILRAVYNRAVERGLTQDRKPFRTVFTGMEKTRKRAISFKEIKRVHDLELSSRPHLEFARDMFLFLFYCRACPSSTRHS